MMDDRKKRFFDGTRTFNNNNNIQILRKFGYERCVCKKKIRIRVENRVESRWCMEKRKLNCSGTLKKRNFLSDESQIVIGNNHKIYIWRKSDEVWLSDCISPGFQRKISAMIWDCISYNGVGTLCKVNGTINIPINTLKLYIITYSQ